MLIERIEIRQREMERSLQETIKKTIVDELDRQEIGGRSALAIAMNSVDIDRLAKRIAQVVLR